MTSLSLVGGRALLPYGVQDNVTVTLDDGEIAQIGGRSVGREWRVDGLIVAPGVIDLHGDAFERQLMPRPRVHFDPRIALIDSDRQLITNGITTCFHGLTYSWEPGLRSVTAGRALIAAINAVRPKLASDTHIHLRWETYNVEAENEIVEWLRARVISLLAFNDHTPGMVYKASQPDGLFEYTERSGLKLDAFRALLDRVAARQAVVPNVVERLAAAARVAGVPMASHDDETPDQRRWYSSLGSTISEFPKNEPTARVARESGHHIVMGAPNVVRGGSHLSAVSASEMVGRGLCSILTSDYYYPALLYAPFRLATDGICSLAEAWKLVASNPAAAARLDDRGVIAPGKRADLVLIDDSDPTLPRVVATLVAGRAVFCERMELAGELAPA